MLQYLPKWIMRRLKMLWNNFGRDTFSFDDARNALKDDDSRMVAVVLSELSRSGWLQVRTDPKNARRKIYSFKTPDVTEQIVKVEVES